MEPFWGTFYSTCFSKSVWLNPCVNLLVSLENQPSFCLQGARSDIKKGTCIQIVSLPGFLLATSLRDNMLGFGWFWVPLLVVTGLQVRVSASSSVVEEGLYGAAVLWVKAVKWAGKQAVPPSGWILFYLWETEASFLQGLWGRWALTHKTLWQLRNILEDFLKSLSW